MATGFGHILHQLPTQPGTQLLPLLIGQLREDRVVLCFCCGYSQDAIPPPVGLFCPLGQGLGQPNVERRFCKAVNGFNGL